MSTAKVCIRAGASGADDRFNYKSSDASTAPNRLKLVIEYTTWSATPTATAGPRLTRSTSSTNTTTQIWIRNYISVCRKQA